MTSDTIKTVWVLVFSVIYKLEYGQLIQPLRLFCLAIGDSSSQLKSQHCINDIMYWCQSLTVLYITNLFSSNKAIVRVNLQNSSNNQNVCNKAADLFHFHEDTVWLTFQFSKWYLIRCDVCIISYNTKKHNWEYIYIRNWMASDTIKTVFLLTCVCSVVYEVESGKRGFC